MHQCASEFVFGALQRFPAVPAHTAAPKVAHEQPTVGWGTTELHFSLATFSLLMSYQYESMLFLVLVSSIKNTHFNSISK